MQYSTDDKRAIKFYEEAMAAYDARNNNEAIELLQKAISRDGQFVEPHLMLYEVYRSIGEPRKAEDHLSQGMDMNPGIYPAGFFFLGELKMQRGEYQGALDNFKKYAGLPNGRSEMQRFANRQVDNCKFAMEQLDRPVPFDPQNLGEAINSPTGEYYPCLTADDQTLIFTRLLKDPESYSGRNEDFFISKKSNGQWAPAKPLYQINTKMNEGAPTISSDGRFLVFTACEVFGEYGPGREGFGSCDLFYAVQEGGRWSQPENLSDNVNTHNWETQPSLSADGRTLYFIRGITTRGGVKNQDIYVTHRRDDGSWSKAEKLASNLNTELSEESVLIHPDGQTLYFSSDGHLTMGGLDIYMSRRQSDGSWSNPLNLGYPINTYGDENSLTVSADGKMAYFASNREGGLGALDLYRFELYKEARPTPVTYAKGKVYDEETNEPLAAEFELIDLSRDSVVVESTSDKESGEFLVSIPLGRNYALNADADGYLFFSEHFAVDSARSGEPFFFDVPMKPIKEGKSVVLKNVFFDTDEYVLKSDSKAELDRLQSFLEKNPGIRIELSGHTDNQGDDQYNLELSQNRAQAVKSYLEEKGISPERLVAKGYGENQPIATNDTKEGRAKNRRTEFKVIGN